LMHKSHLELMSKWIHEEAENKKDNFVLTKQQKYSVVKTYHACPDFSKEQKDALKAIVMKDDNSDEGLQCVKYCDMVLPDADLKAKLWAEITDPKTTEPQKDLKLKMMCFFQRKQQLDLIQPYFEKYYNTLLEVANGRDREFIEIFMNFMSPAAMARDEDLKQFKAIQEKANKEQEFFCLFLTKQVELIEVSKRAKELCAKFK